MTSSLPLHSVSRVNAQGKTTIELSKATFRVDLDAYEGAVFEWK